MFEYPEEIRNQKPETLLASNFPPAVSWRIMNRRILIAALLLSLTAAAQTGMERAPLDPSYGRVPHPTSSTNAEAQKYFEQGMALYYGFNHDEAVRSFTAATQLDPDMTMAYWGIALSLGPNYNLAVDAAREKQAYDALQNAVQHMAKANQKEKDYVAALAKRYTTAADPDYKKLSEAYARAMHGLAEQNPDDMDAATLYAESLMDLRPWRLWAKDGTPAPETEEIVRTLESVLHREPEHIGANHLYIHAVEASPHPERALKSADRLAAMAPASGHLVHMPGHIYIRTGNHERSLETNRAAATVDEDFFRKTHAQGTYTMYYMHNLHFITVEAATLGRSGEAAASAQKIYNQLEPHVKEMPSMDPFLAMPALVAVRFRRWDDVLKMPAPAGDLPMSTYQWHYSRAMAFAGKQQRAHAARELAEMNKLAPAARKVPLNSLGTGNSEKVVKLSQLIVEAQIEPLKMLNHLRQAVAVEDQLDYDEPPNWIAPVRESLGGALLRANKPSEAEKVFREDLARNPNNGRSLFGLAEALRMQHKPDSAARAEYQKAWATADVQLTLDQL